MSAPVRRHRRRWNITGAAWLVLAAAGGLSGCRLVRAPIQDPGSRLQMDIEAMLSSSAEAWNRGDLEAFVSDYRDSPSTTYIGSIGRITGREAIRERYAPRFAPGAERDSLRFESLWTRLLGREFALASARYVLHRAGATSSSGPFTLVLRRAEGRWWIIYDHSSSDSPLPASPQPPDSS